MMPRLALAVKGHEDATINIARLRKQTAQREHRAHVAMIWIEETSSEQVSMVFDGSYAQHPDSTLALGIKPSNGINDPLEDPRQFVLK